MAEETSKVTTAPSRKVRFTPKIPPRKAPKPTLTKTKEIEDTEAAQTRELLRRVNEGSRRRGSKVERKAPVQVAFGPSGASPSIRTFGRGISSRSIESVLQEGSSRSSEPILQDLESNDGPDASDKKKKKKYVECWDYNNYYPVTLPLRKPHSGNPEQLDEEEFGGDSANLEYDEDSINHAAELGLMEESEEARMLFLQLPTSLPLVKRSASAKGKEIAESLSPPRRAGTAEKGCSLEELPAGFVGKMLVHKSGAIKLKLGQTLYDEAICSALEDYNKQIEQPKEEMNDATHGADNIRNDISALAQRYAVIECDESCEVCRKKILTVGGARRMVSGYTSVGPMAPFYVFPCGHAFHSQCLIAHVTRCSSQANAEYILDLQKKLSLLGGKAPKDSNGTFTEEQSITSMNPKDKLRSQLDDAIASECPFCGDLMIREISMPFILPEEARHATSWEIKPPHQLGGQKSLHIAI